MLMCSYLWGIFLPEQIGIRTDTTLKRQTLTVFLAVAFYSQSRMNERILTLKRPETRKPWNLSLSLFSAVSTLLPGYFMMPRNKPYQSLIEGGQEFVKLDLRIYLIPLIYWELLSEAKKNRDELVMGAARVIRCSPQSTSVVVKRRTRAILSSQCVSKQVGALTLQGTKTIKIHLNLENSCWQPSHSQPHGGQ